MTERLTRRNPGDTYRIPMATQKSLRLEWQQESLTIFGEVADRLGQYEDLGTPEELALLKMKIEQEHRRKDGSVF